MKSMTGYGRGEATSGGLSIVVEMKSVNNRFCDIQIRMPRAYMALEVRVKRALQEHIQRGRVDVFIKRTASEGSHTISADPLLAERYVKAMQVVANRLQRDVGEIPLQFVLQQPGVMVQAEQEPDALGEWTLVSTALEAARADLMEMRVTEGRALEADLHHHLSRLQVLRDEVSAHSEGINERLQARLMTRVRRLLGDRVDPIRLTQEAALLADKADVSEELARILSHCQQFKDIIEGDETIGRKLEFLLQELNREINTIGSKAAEHPISTRVVEMKSVLERMREQVANVE